ncbi:helix-turn-helix domain-containing protein [Enterococcus faecalis]|uniref:helix-turn-helix domain-containing protein n=1 Tax=Enterococcus faecalis TaxID=1351 RepID=UPI003BF5952A
MEIFAENYQMVDSIAKNLYVSRTSIYKELKILKTNLKVFNLKIKNLKIMPRSIKIKQL